ncbi:hypothetical protein [Anaeroselena agilis]|uniref:Type VI secretion system spike protein VgrG3-like C-terminal domain-containing protein n=1 Tax=Anaeroselena agilis TaxID=3063788 RepID=A0ABU3NX24_9FIRM|nr:hypothetical protein [Selenomonadales bacterium 4137-cl]
MELGRLSAKYESRGNPGTVSSGRGDAGGVSFGVYQFSWNYGVAQNFAVKFADRYPDLANNVENLDAFCDAWRAYANANPEGFATAQYEYALDMYYVPAISKLAEAGWHIEKHHPVMQDVVWSRVIQYGLGYLVEMWETACRIMGYPNLSYIDAANFDADLVKTIYLKVCRTPEWTGGSPSLRPGLYSRFENECADALAAIGA